MASSVTPEARKKILEALKTFHGGFTTRQVQERSGQEWSGIIETLRIETKAGKIRRITNKTDIIYLRE